MRDFKREYMSLCRKRVYSIVATNENRILTLKNPRSIARVPYDYNLFEHERISTIELIGRGYIVKEGVIV